MHVRLLGIVTVAMVMPSFYKVLRIKPSVKTCDC